MSDLELEAEARLQACRALCGPPEPIIRGHCDHLPQCPYVTNASPYQRADSKIHEGADHA